MESSSDKIFQVIVSETTRILGSNASRPVISMETDLTEAGLDSLSIVNLVSAVEMELGVQGVDLQRWLDDQMELAGARFTVGSLVQQFLTLP